MNKKQKREAQKAEQAAQVTEIVPETPVVVTAPSTGSKSIRTLVLAGIAAGRSTPEIAADVVAQFPNSQAAQKSKGHIAWYRTRAKKQGTPEYVAVQKLLAAQTTATNTALSA